MRSILQPGSALRRVVEDEKGISAVVVSTLRCLDGMAMTEVGAVLVIDEIETGLEPHRLSGLLRGLRKKAWSEGGQVIITTHSPVAITELSEFEAAAVHSTDGVMSVRKMATRTAASRCSRLLVL